MWAKAFTPSQLAVIPFQLNKKQVVVCAAYRKINIYSIYGAKKQYTEASVCIQCGSYRKVLQKSTSMWQKTCRKKTISLLISGLSSQCFDVSAKKNSVDRCLNADTWHLGRFEVNVNKSVTPGKIC